MAQVFDLAGFSSGDSVLDRSEKLIETEGGPFAEVIRWLVPVNDHIIICKDGSMLACMDFTGMDLDSSSPEALMQVRDQLLYATEQLQEDSPTLAWHVRRRITQNYPSAQYPDPISARMDAIQHEQFIEDVQFINRHTLVLSIAPQSKATRLIAALERSQQRGAGLGQQLSAMTSSLWKSVWGEDEFTYEDWSEVQSAAEYFEKVLSTFLASTANLKTRILRGEELGGFLQLSTSPTSDLDVRASLPDEHAFMDETMPVDNVDAAYADAMHFTRNHQQAWLSAYSLDFRKRKSQVDFFMLDRLMSAPFEFTLAHVFKALPRPKAKRAVGEAEAYHSNRRYSIWALLMAAAKSGSLEGVPVKESRQTDTDEAKALKDQIDGGHEGAGLYYGTVVVHAASPTQLITARKQCEEILQACHLNPRLEGMHKFSSFCATIPGSHEEAARWVKITTENFIDLCPTRTVSEGSFLNDYLSEQLQQPCPALVAFRTRNRTPFYYTGYVGDVGHELIIGPTGTGKTAIAIVLWSQFRKYPGSRVVIFDKNYSCRPAVYLQGGSYIDLNQERQGQASRYAMSPIAALMANGNLRHISFLARWIELLATVRGYKPSSNERKQLENALRVTAEMGVADPLALRLGTVVVRLDSTSELAKALDMWVGESALAPYFDNPSDSFDLGSLVGVEMGTILSDEELAAPFMMYAFYRLATQLRDMGGSEDKPIPTLIYIPEAWYFIRQPQFAAELDEWLVTLRKLGARVVFDTQNPDKLVASSVFPALRDSALCLIFTPNDRAKTRSLNEMYSKELGMDDQQIQFIINGVAKRDYYIRQGQVDRRISFGMNPELLAMVRSDAKAQKLLERFIAQGLPHGWQQRYLGELQES